MEPEQDKQSKLPSYRNKRQNYSSVMLNASHICRNYFQMKSKSRILCKTYRAPSIHNINNTAQEGVSCTSGSNWSHEGRVVSTWRRRHETCTELCVRAHAGGCQHSSRKRSTKQLHCNKGKAKATSSRTQSVTTRWRLLLRAAVGMITSTR